jgi:hypothetical protein
MRVAAGMLLALVALPSGYCAWASISAARTYNYALSDMDWDSSGGVSVSEFFESADVGAREAPGGCTEFFSLKMVAPSANGALRGR